MQPNEDFKIVNWIKYLWAFNFIIFLLSGLAVSDIHKIQEEVDTYYHISIVETLASTSFVRLQDISTTKLNPDFSTQNFQLWTIQPWTF